MTSIAVGGGFVARATVRDGTGAPVAGRVVNFSVGGSDVAVVTPATALTNASGVAEVAISPASLAAIGATTLTAASTVGTTAVSGQFDFSVAASSLSLSAIAVTNANLPSGGNTSLSVTASVGNAPTALPVNVSFTASCGQINGQDTSAAGVSVTTNGSGVASVSYSAVGAQATLCSGPVTITASAVGAAAKTATINVAPPVANAVAFVSAAPAQIFVAGSGAVDQSVVRFVVRSSAGTPLPGVSVVFSIETNPGGVGLNAAGSPANVTGTTNQAGEVTVSLFSGTIPGPVKVRAALSSNLTVFSESQNLTVASGPPSQRFMSLSVQTFNIEGWRVDGTSTRLTVRLADRQGNPVNDGTVVNFTAEGGQVASSCATTKTNGISSCSVDFISQNPRPEGGRVSILAFTEGTKDYDDVNQNNRYDAGTDALKNIGDPYRDDDENNAFTTGEFVVPRGGTLSCAGAAGSFPAKPDTCDSNLATTVRQQTVIFFSSSIARMKELVASSGSIRFRLASDDNPQLPMPAGTTVGASTSVDGCSVTDVAGSPVVSVGPRIGDKNEDASTPVSIGLKGCPSGARIVVRVTAPSGLATAFDVQVP